jgi:hypothetical protein
VESSSTRQIIAMSAGSQALSPLVINRDGFAQDWSADFTVQNTGHYRLRHPVYMSNAADAEVHWDYNPTMSIHLAVGVP